MKYKRKWVRDGLLLTTLTCGLMSGAEATESASPYMYPACKGTIIDDSIGSVYFDKSCKNVYLTPKSIEKPWVNIRMEQNIQLCDAHENLLASKTNLTEAINLLTQKMAAAYADGDIDKGDQYQESIAKLSDTLDKVSIQYDNVGRRHAATMQATFQNEVTQGQMERFLGRHYTTLAHGDDEPKIVHVTPVSDSYYSFILRQPNPLDGPAQSIISTNMPGLEYLVKADPAERQPSIAHVEAAQAVSGEAQISLIGACPMTKIVQGQRVLDDSKVDNFMTVSRTYAVPMQYSYGYTATMDVQTAANLFFKMVQSVGQFSKSQYYEKLLSHQGSSVFSVKWESDGPTDKLQEELVMTEIHKRLIDSFTEHLANSGLVVPQAPTVIEAPAGGFVDSVHAARRCWNKSFLGIKVDSGCHTYHYTVKNWVNGQSSNTILDSAVKDLQVSESYQGNGHLDIPHTTSFIYKDLKKAGEEQ